MNYFTNWFESDPERVVDSVDVSGVKAKLRAEKNKKILNLTKSCVSELNRRGECYVYYNSEAEELFKKKGFVTEKVDLDEYDNGGMSYTIAHLHVKLP